MEGKSKLISLDTKITKLLGLLLIIAFLYWLGFGDLRPQASSQAIIQEAVPQSLAKDLNYNIEVKSNGDIYINDQKTKETVIRHQEYDEVKLILVDELGDFIPKITVTLSLPTALASKENSHDILAIHGVNAQKPKLLENNQIFFAANNIEPTARITIFAQMPKHSLDLSMRAKILSIGSTYDLWFFWLLGILIPVLTIGWLKLSYWLKMKPATPVGAITEPPSNLPPAAVGLLVNGRIGYQQLAATLVHLASRGDIQLVQTTRGYRIAKKRELVNLNQTEQFLIDELRLKLGPISQQEIIEQEVKKQLFSKKITNAYESVFQELEQRGFFAFNPYSLRNKYRFWGLFTITISLILSVLAVMSLTSGIQLIPALAGLFIAGWLILLLTPQLPPLTSVGSIERAKWQSFKNHLNERTPMSGGQENANKFLNYLALAITLNSTHNWLARFNSQFILVPEWYFNEQDPSSLEAFINGLENMTSEISRTLTEASLPVT